MNNSLPRRGFGKLTENYTFKLRLKCVVYVTDIVPFRVIEVCPASRKFLSAELSYKWALKRRRLHLWFHRELQQRRWEAPWPGVEAHASANSHSAFPWPKPSEKTKFRLLLAYRSSHASMTGFLIKSHLKNNAVESMCIATWRSRHKNKN